MTKYKPAEAPAPLPALSFTDAEDKPRSLSDWHGKLIILNYWATWCAPCIKEMPSLDRLAAAVDPATTVVLALSQDRAGRAKAQEFYDKIGIRTLPLLVDQTGASGRAVKLRGLPTTLIISPDGKELGRLEGTAEWDHPPARALIAHYLRN